MSDDDALKDIRKGGRQGFLVLYQRYEPKLCRYMSNSGVSESDRDDVIQEIFFQFFKTLIKDTFKQECSLSTWLYEIRKNIVCNYWRQQHQTSNHLESLSQCDEDEGEEDNPAVNALSEEQSAKAHNDFERQLCIDRILQKLERSDNQLCHCLTVLIWHVIEDKPLIKIATLINKSVGATQQYLFKCSKKLRQYLPLQDC
ncbi:MAG: sigma-70 family RNA polymerase sigma factor [Thioploca sp.]|nr:sigma-70 family RNA polymerase sigma factor [Thioploca sp.]